jgi:hypothetical protein
MTKKFYCYKSDCCVTETGFNTLLIQVCTTCKCEVDRALYERIKAKQDEKEKADKEKVEGSEIELPFWEFL